MEKITIDFLKKFIVVKYKYCIKRILWKKKKCTMGVFLKMKRPDMLIGFIEGCFSTAC